MVHQREGKVVKPGLSILKVGTFGMVTCWRGNWLSSCYCLTNFASSPVNIAKCRVWVWLEWAAARNMTEIINYD